MRSPSIRWVAIPALAALWLSVGINAQAQQLALLDQQQLQSKLTQGTPDERDAAIEGILLIPANQRSPATLSALISEADRLTGELEQRAAALSAGRHLEPLADEGAYLFQIQEALCQSDDPRVIRPLAAQISGNRVMNALADFGDLAVPELSKAAARDTPDTSLAILTLTRTLTRQVRVPVTVQSKQLLTELAAKRLKPPQESGVLSRSVELAVALGDPRLKQTVQELVDSDANVRSFGITDANLIESVRSAASKALQTRP